jgi:tetratricopeptide (TPR) repeat protein
VQFREALALAPGDRRSQAALAAKLADTILWQYSWEQSVAVAEAALTALAEDQFNPEAVSLLEVISRSCRTGQDLERAQKHADRLKQILPRVPYFDSLYLAHYGLAVQGMRTGNFPEAQKWLQVMEEVCSRHHHENGLARCFHGRGDLATYQGDHATAAYWLARSLELCERTGDSQVLLEGHAERARALVRIGGDPCEIEMHVERMMSIARGMATGGGFATAAEMSRQMADAYYNRGDDENAVIAYRRALDLDARQHSDEILRRLEQSYLRLNRREEFSDYCRRVRVDPLPGSNGRPHYWRLVPGACDLSHLQLMWEDRFAGSAPAAGWEVTLPEAPASAALMLEAGSLHLRAMPLLQGPSVPLPVPRLLRQVSGDFAVEAVLVDTADPDCHTAGLLLWVSEGNFLMFGKFHAEGNEVRLKASQGDRTIGRGWLPGPELHLLLLCRSGCVSAWSSRDGTQWFCAGETLISDEDPLRVGLFVACVPPRSVSVGHFQAFRLYRLEQQ